MAFINRDIWLNWTCRYCGQSGTKYGPSFTSRNRKVKHSHCNRTTGIVQWTGCSQSAHPLLCINLHGINVVPQPITDIQNIDRQIVIDDENEPYMNNVMDEDESIDDNDKENISVLSNTNSAALGVAGAKRTFGEMMESDEISSAEKFEVIVGAFTKLVNDGEVKQGCNAIAQCIDIVTNKLFSVFNADCDEDE
eukprot:418892_1